MKPVGDAQIVVEEEMRLVSNQKMDRPITYDAEIIVQLERDGDMKRKNQKNA